MVLIPLDFIKDSKFFFSNNIIIAHFSFLFFQLSATLVNSQCFGPWGNGAVARNSFTVWAPEAVVTCAWWTSAWMDDLVDLFDGNLFVWYFYLRIFKRLVSLSWDNHKNQANDWKKPKNIPKLLGNAGRQTHIFWQYRPCRQNLLPLANHVFLPFSLCKSVA